MTQELVTTIIIGAGGICLFMVGFHFGRGQTEYWLKVATKMGYDTGVQAYRQALIAKGVDLNDLEGVSNERSEGEGEGTKSEYKVGF